MKKVLLISTSIQYDIQTRGSDNNSYGLGLSYLHAVIEQAGYRIVTQSYNDIEELKAFKQISETLKNYQPDYLLIQMLTIIRVSAYRIISFVKKQYPNVKIILGGVHATALYEQLLSNFPVDYIVMGEGEITCIELLNALDSGAAVKSILGIVYKCGADIVRTSERPLIENLDNLPFPKHELFMTSKREIACLLTSRGCPQKCSFCCLHHLSKQKFRGRSAENIADEIEYILDHFPQIKIIQFVDDAFNIDIERAKAVCREIISRKVKIQIYCSCRFKPMDMELLELMEQAGFTAIGLGLETGSEKLLKAMHKNITPSDAKYFFNLLKNTNLKVSTFLMVGFPEENSETVRQTICLAKELSRIKPYKLTGVNPLWIYPKTEIFDIAQRKGLLDNTYWLTVRDVPYYTVKYSYSELFFMAIKINYFNSPLKCFLSMCKHAVRIFITSKLVNFLRFYRLRKLRKLYDYDGII